MKIPSFKKNIIIAIIIFSILLIMFGWLGWQNNFFALEASQNSNKNTSLSSKNFNYNDLQVLPKKQNEKIEEQVPEAKENNLDNPNQKSPKTLYPQIKEIEEIKEPHKYRPKSTPKPNQNNRSQTIKKNPHLQKAKNKRKMMQKKLVYQNQKIIDLKEKILILENEKNKPKELEKQFSEQIKPQLESQIQGMNIYNVYLGKKSDKDMALGWLRKNFSNQHYQINFSYGLYNSQIIQSTVFFDSRIKEPPPKNLLLVYFDGGTRDKANNCYSLEALKTLGNGAQNMYILWQDENPFNDKNFIQNNFCTDLIYEKGSFLGGPSYLNVKHISLKKINTNEIIATFPVECQIEVPCSLDGLNLELKFPFYNYKTEGLFSNTHIKSLRKINVYSKHTGQSKTLYYKI
ncbi:conserved hypothetical protein [Aster yellows witches'-broom phytoplasma AYWB]|uniref:Sequence-variable mosaic (SVM) signal sequence domain-containing protein n=3 Tax=16SrI (Aster yellows group) TaxID=3042590 RepID=Q2NJ43_AYWBP|nr:hypothetical protein [Aster yellows witches'-broom phytoplasma]ABC65550.1 conserved hypothetical protein [Aster yellows witches'-broom phytoplasma AYWB]PEH36235.1 hypothetical protein BBA70_02070 [New Jersey aster yellows phytoplasma]